MNLEKLKNSILGARLASAYFFAFPGLAYGIFTGRMPALKAQMNANDAQIGILLFVFGAASFLGLLASNFSINRFGAKSLTSFSVLGFTFGLLIATIFTNIWLVCAFGAFAGFSTGLCDVAMNAQAIGIEQHYKIRTMGFFHACFSLGGVIGALTASLFAWLAFSIFINMLIIFCLYLCIWPIAYLCAFSNKSEQKRKIKDKSGVPLFVYFCGIMSFMCYVSEGSVGEWGSLLLHSVKGAPQQEAALVFAAFSTSMVICRFCSDKLRSKLSDFTIVFCGSLLGACGMTLVLLSPLSWLCLAGYSIMGIGFAPIVPILFSRAGSVPGVSPGRASSAMSTLSYTGLLFFPPFLGTLAEYIGLGSALWVIVLTSFIVTCASFALRKNTI